MSISMYDRHVVCGKGRRRYIGWCCECGVLLDNLRLAKTHMNRCRVAAGWRTGARVETPNGPGVIVGTNTPKPGPRGPGPRRYRVQLDDGRIRHYRFETLSGPLPAAGASSLPQKITNNFPLFRP